MQLHGVEPDGPDDETSDFFEGHQMTTHAAEVFSPGEYLREELDERGWTQEEFAEILGKSLKQVNEVLQGRSTITISFAQALGAALGTSAELWLNLETAYRLATAEPVPSTIERKGRLRSEFPVRDMQKRGWIPKTESVDELERSVFAFYDVTGYEQQTPLAYAAKRLEYSSELSRVQEAFVLRVRQLAQHVQVATYREAALRECLSAFRNLLPSPEALGQVPRLLADAGVRFVICEPFAGSKIDGVCTWLDAQSPVIGMTLRLDRIDNFWFVLRHECEHVLRRDGIAEDYLGAVVDDDLHGRAPDALPEHEVAANAAASEFCVPEEGLSNWMARSGPFVSRDRVIAFAESLSVHPGIVVGQLQRRMNRWDLFRPLLVKVRALVTPFALTDGYGHIIGAAL